jgi:C-terminal processing protease CtpA/Prc
MLNKVWLIIFSVILFSAGCSSFSSELPTKADPLEDMNISRTLLEKPQDEEQRLELPLGVFTGVVVGDSRQTLEERLEAPEGVLVTKIVENSPAAAAGIQVGDIILEAAIDENTPNLLHWPSDWFKLEQTARPDSVIHVLCDRAGRDFKASIRPVKRISPPDSLKVETFREEDKVGIIVRNASEVEADKAGLSRGEGCVVVGLAGASPWRQAGVLFGDVIIEINDRIIKNPQELLITINELKTSNDVKIIVFRENKKVTINTWISGRQKETREFNIPFIFSYGNKGGIEKTSVLFGLFSVRKTRAASEYRICWLIHYTSGDSTRLEEIK